MLAAGKSKAQIAKALGRDRTTISRELRRNGLKGLYVAIDAQRRAERRYALARARSRKMNQAENLEYVKDGLRKRWPPDRIAGRSQRDFPDDPRRKLFHTTIYTWIDNDDHCQR